MKLRVPRMVSKMVYRKVNGKVHKSVCEKVQKKVGSRMCRKMHGRMCMWLPVILSIIGLMATQSLLILVTAWSVLECFLVVVFKQFINFV